MRRLWPLSPLALAALAALAAGCGQGLSGGSSAAATGSPLCSAQGGTSFTPGTSAQTIATAPRRSKLLELAIDARWAVWSEDTPSGGVLCQYNFATQGTTALAKGPIAALGLGTTDAGVYFVAGVSGGGQALRRIDHTGLSAPTIAQGISAPISARNGYVAYAVAQGDKLRVTVLDTRRPRGRQRVVRETTPRCQAGGDCLSVVAVQMLAGGVAWMSAASAGSGQSVLSYAPLSGGTTSTENVDADVGRGLVAGDSEVAYAGASGGWFAWRPGSTPEPLILPTGARPAALAGRAIYAVAVHDGDSTLFDARASGSGTTPLDSTAGLTSGSQTGALAAVAAGPTQLCDLVNIYARAAPGGQAPPVRAYVRCATLGSSA